MGEAFDKVGEALRLRLSGRGGHGRPRPRRGRARPSPSPIPRSIKATTGTTFLSGLEDRRGSAARAVQGARRRGPPANIAASFQKAAIDLLLSRLFRAVEDSGLSRVVAGGGVAANSYLRRALSARSDIEAIFPPLRLCGDNGAMVAGIACKYLERGKARASTWASRPAYRFSAS